MEEQIKAEINLLKNSQEIRKIHKGFSSDEKFLVILGDNTKVLLRLFELHEYDSKRTEFSILEKMQELGIRCLRPIQIGRITNRGYLITSYIEGEDAQEELPLYSETEQYQIGFQAGQELRKMHHYEAPQHISSWYERKVEKHRNYIQAYFKGDQRVKNDHKIIRFIEENIHLMKNRPNLFQHDDFTVGNIIVKDRAFAGVIDFNRYDWGDPIHEFLKVGLFSREVSIPFSIGQIQGYFNGQEPEEPFWHLYSLYLAMSVFSSVVWTMRTIPDDMENMLKKIERVLDDHQSFDRVIPTWYLMSNHSRSSRSIPLET